MDQSSATPLQPTTNMDQSFTDSQPTETNTDLSGANTAQTNKQTPCFYMASDINGNMLPTEFAMPCLTIGQLINLKNKDDMPVTNTFAIFLFCFSQHGKAPVFCGFRCQHFYKK